MRNGAGLDFEDALSLARALSALGGGYADVARQLLKVGGGGEEAGGHCLALAGRCVLQGWALCVQCLVHPLTLAS